MSKIGRQRSVMIDGLKSISILYIVGFWHLLNYADGLRPAYQNHGTEAATVTALAMFTLLSGYLASQTPIHSAADAMDYYRRRAVRIYIPFLIAASVFALLHISSRASLLKGITLVSMITGDAPMTLWYLNMICLCYILAPALMNLSSKPVLFAASVIGITGVVVGLCQIFHNSDHRLALYFPCFALGIAIQAFPLLRQRALAWIFAAAAPVAFLITLTAPPLAVETSLRSLPWALCSAGAIFLVARSLTATKTEIRPAMPLWARAIILVSNISFSLYLVHRPVYVLLHAVLGYRFAPYPQLVFLIACCVPLALMEAYAFDRLSRLITGSLREGALRGSALSRGH